MLRKDIEQPAADESKLIASRVAMGAKLELSGAPRCAGDAVAFPFIVHAGEMKIEAIDVFEFDSDGRVASMKAYWGPENAR